MLILATGRYKGGTKMEIPHSLEIAGKIFSMESPQSRDPAEHCTEVSSTLPVTPTARAYRGNAVLRVRQEEAMTARGSLVLCLMVDSETSNDSEDSPGMWWGQEVHISSFPCSFPPYSSEVARLSVLSWSSHLYLVAHSGNRVTL